MLAAASYSLHKDKLVWEHIGTWGHLPLTLHRCIHTGDDDVLTPPGFYTVRCTDGLICARCTSGQGGYTFRWFSPLWSAAYIAGARPGAWLPGKSEERWRRPADVKWLDEHVATGGTHLASGPGP